MNLLKRFKSHFLLFFLLPLCVVKGEQILDTYSIWTPADILTHLTIQQNTYPTANKISLWPHDSYPSFQFAVGIYRARRLGYFMIESKHAFKKPSLQLYSFGGGFRTNKSYQWLPYKMKGVYLFLDNTFKEAAALSEIFNLTNLNIGIESTLFQDYQATFNLYVPIKAYQYNRECFSIHAKENSQYAIRQPYYLESDNYGCDISLRKTFSFRKLKAHIQIGGYGYYDRAKELNPISFKREGKEADPIIGGAHQMTLEWSNLSAYYKIAYDPLRSLMISLGMQWKHSTHNPLRAHHRALWAPAIERHVSPLFAAHLIEMNQEIREINGRLWLQKCKEIFEKNDYTIIERVFKKSQAHKNDLLACIMHAKDLDHAIKKISLFTHPDKNQSIPLDHNTFISQILPILYERRWELYETQQD